MRRIYVLMSLMMLFLAGCRHDVPAPLFQVLHRPHLVMIQDTLTARYEIHVEAIDSIEVRTLKVCWAADSSVIVTFDQSTLKSRWGRIDDRDTRNRSDKAMMSVLYVDIVLPARTQSHEGIIHQIEWVQKNGGEKPTSVWTAPVTFSQQEPVRFSSPFREGIWAAVYSEHWERGHRRVFYTRGGKSRLPGRYAIDFIKMDNEGRYARADEDSIKNWYSYGVPVLAVADGVVASVRNDFTESPTLSKHPRHSADDGTGNHVSLDLGDGRYVFYEHLQPGSISLKPGDRVKRGEVIGAAGFTGQTTGPHLHLHVADTDSPLGAEGIPFVFEEFTVLGAYDNFSTFGKEVWSTHALYTGVRRQQMPGANHVIRFQ
jgi:murein DD-endopeptidase